MHHDLIPESSPAFHAFAALRNGDIDRAAQLISALKGEKAEYATLSVSARIALEQGDDKVAWRRFEKSIALNPLANAAYLSLLQLSKCYGYAKHTSRFLRASLLLDPRPAGHWADLALSDVQLDAGLRRKSGLRACALRPGSSISYLAVIAGLEDRPRAVEQLAILGIGIDPRVAELHLRRGVSLSAGDDPFRAVLSYRRHAALVPGAGLAQLRIGDLYRDSGFIDTARRLYVLGYKLSPGNREIADSIIGCLIRSPTVKPEAAHHAARRWGEGVAGVGAPIIHRRVGAVRIGFLSSYLGWDPTGRTLLALLGGLDDRKFRVIAYDAGEMGGEVSVEIAKRSRKLAAVKNRPAPEIAETIRRDGVEILIDLDGHRTGNRLDVLMERCAPKQLSWIGEPVTTGLVNMDYYLTDRIITPSAEDRLFSETVRTIDACYRFHPDLGEMVPVSASPGRDAGFPTFAVYEDSEFLSDTFLDATASLMERTPDARLTFYAQGYQRSGVRKTVLDRLRRRGIGAKRVGFALFSDHMTMMREYRHCDVVLDPFPYGGVLSVSTALWMGVPVVSLYADRMAGRRGSSILQDVGLGEWSATSVANYIDIACALGKDAASNPGLRHHVHERFMRSGHLDAKRFASRFAETLLSL